jgi:hypothetical protein
VTAARPSPTETIGAIPAPVDALLQHVGLAWGCPVALARISLHGRRIAEFIPTSDGKGLRKSDCSRRLPACLKRVARSHPTYLKEPVPLTGVACPKGTVMAAPFSLPGNQLYLLLVGCQLPALAGTRVDTDPTPSLAATPRFARPLCDQKPSAVRNAVLGLRRDVRAILEVFEKARQFDVEVVRYPRSVREISRAAASFLDDPDSEETLIKPFRHRPDVRAVAHLEVRCDWHGRGLLRHRWFAARSDGQDLHRISRRRLNPPDFELDGALWESWDAERSDRACDFYGLEGLKSDPSQDSLKQYVEAIERYIKPCTFVVIGRLGRNIARGSCDIDPHCVHRVGNQCRLMIREREDLAAQRGWRKRLEAVDLVFVDRASPEDEAFMAMVQTVSLFRSISLEQADFERVWLPALPSFPQKEQRRHLCRLLDRCRAMPDAQSKGAAFERLACGLLRLVPGWLPGEPNRRTEGNELDITILVEPANEKARYWFEIFGPKILVECKNYPDQPLGAKVKGQSPVRKLLNNMKKGNVHLGLLLCTGEISKALWQQAQQSFQSDRLVVLLDGRRVQALAEDPGDMEAMMKQWVSDAAIGVFTVLQPGRRRRKKRKKP